MDTYLPRCDMVPMRYGIDASIANQTDYRSSATYNQKREWF